MFSGFPVHVHVICHLSGHALFPLLIKEIREKLIGSMDMTVGSFGGLDYMEESL